MSRHWAFGGAIDSVHSSMYGCSILSHTHIATSHWPRATDATSKRKEEHMTNARENWNMVVSHPNPLNIRWHGTDCYSCVQEARLHDFP